ncbi:MAG: ABC transporter ATP-binding protein [Planctomycetes bacterium]|nr:ABC transporter ATP-binding protein [Planctomycetota bacterium]
MPDSESVIQTKNLSKTYKDFWGRARVTALNDLSIDVVRGEVFAIIGPNGSGKTTTMKLLLGLLFPSMGSASVLGRPPSDVAAKARIGFLPEESYLYRFLNADETLDFYGRLFNIDRETRRRRIDALIERFGMQRARKRQIREYSKGMVRRISFAQALINDPEIVFLDEPTSGLDPISQREMKDLILELKKKGKTVFLSSHLLADVQEICDRIAILHNGQLKEYGAVKDILVRRDHVTMTFRNLSDEARRRLEEFAQKQGATLVESRATIETLEDVFMRIVQGAPAEPGLEPPAPAKGSGDA